MQIPPTREVRSDRSSPPSETVVLQPHSLVGNVGNSFYQALDTAIDTAIDRTSSRIIIDLLWIDHWDTETIKLLVKASLKAHSQGHSLTFLGMDPATRTKFDQSVQQGHQADRAGSYSVFDPDFEAFLEHHHQVKSEALLRY
jgi:anti-anti-sigma regulatory factor